MVENSRTVFVLGAGFTKAFVPDAPLLVDDYNLDSLCVKYKDFEKARKILELELHSGINGKVNLERLMTRLDSLMPYDFEHHGSSELDLLFSDVKQLFVQRLPKARGEETSQAGLSKLAEHIVNNRINCVTYNYDDVLDEALWSVTGNVQIIKAPYWHPDGGYGFFCRPSVSCVADGIKTEIDKTSMLLLKLHGSLNWRIKRGHGSPYSIEAIVHEEPWQPDPSYGGKKINRNAIELHLESDPLIVPPVLMKSALGQQPVQRMVWSLAYEKLREADKVVFVGYSFPTTDLAARFLFREALERTPPPEVSVINLANTEDDKEYVRKSYRDALPGMEDKQFDFGGALKWAQEFAKTPN